MPGTDGRKSQPAKTHIPKRREEKKSLFQLVINLKNSGKFLVSFQLVHHFKEKFCAEKFSAF